MPGPKKAKSAPKLAAPMVNPGANPVGKAYVAAMTELSNFDQSGLADKDPAYRAMLAQRVADLAMQVHAEETARAGAAAAGKKYTPAAPVMPTAPGPKAPTVKSSVPAPAMPTMQPMRRGSMGVQGASLAPQPQPGLQLNRQTVGPLFPTDQPQQVAMGPVTWTKSYANCSGNGCVV